VKATRRVISSRRVIIHRRLIIKGIRQRQRSTEVRVSNDPRDWRTLVARSRVRHTKTEDRCTDEFATYPQRERITPEFKPLGGAIACAMRHDKRLRQNSAFREAWRHASRSCSMILQSRNYLELVAASWNCRYRSSRTMVRRTLIIGNIMKTNNRARANERLMRKSESELSILSSKACKCAKK